MQAGCKICGPWGLTVSPNYACISTVRCYQAPIRSVTGRPFHSKPAMRASVSYSSIGLPRQSAMPGRGGRCTLSRTFFYSVPPRNLQRPNGTAATSKFLPRSGRNRWQFYVSNLSLQFLCIPWAPICKYVPANGTPTAEMAGRGPGRLRAP